MGKRAMLPSMARFLLAWAALLASACNGDPPTAMSAPTGGAERSALLGPFLSAHWALPIAPQGAPPAEFSEAEASLSPDLCGGCHPKQYAEWSTSLHAAAFSPGFAGQLIEGSLAAPAQVRNCQTCHTPLAEQQPFGGDGAASPHYQPELRSRGLVCAGCHVRAHRRFGPARRAETPVPTDPIPHDAFEVRPEFSESAFCAPCHQFFDDTGVNGKPLENTFTEWRSSPHAAAGQTCQGCHMPDRAHLWRGIHDPEMVRSAVAVALSVEDGEPGNVRGSLVLTSQQVGHMFPTYVTPRIFLRVWQAGSDGTELEGTRRELVIGRQVDFGRWTEVFDTRVAPGESAVLAYDQPRHDGAATLMGLVSVDPDYHYRGVFESLLTSLTDPGARELIAEALHRASTSIYSLAELQRPLR